MSRPFAILVVVTASLRALLVVAARTLCRDFASFGDFAISQQAGTVARLAIRAERRDHVPDVAAATAATSWIRMARTPITEFQIRTW